MRLNSLEFLLNQAWTAIVRNGVISTAAVTNVAVALCVLAAFGLTTFNLQQMIHAETSKVQITVDLAKDAQPEEVRQALEALPGLASLQFVSREENLASTGRTLPEGFENPLPNSFHIRPADPYKVDELAAQAKAVEGVALERHGAETTKKLLLLSRGLRLVGGVLVLVLAAATLLVVSVTIRLTIYARRREIRIMQLVGATPWFIRFPFLLEGLFQGAVGGIIALIVVLPTYAYLHWVVGESLAFIKLVYSTETMVLLGLLMLLVGCAFGALGSLIGLQRHLHEV